jgi:hypothetical protein
LHNENVEQKMPDGFEAMWRLGLMPAHDVERFGDGFRLADTQYRTGLGLFTEYWLPGAAAALKGGLVNEIAIIGGLEERYPEEEISRAEVVRHLMIKEHGVDERRVTAHISAPHTEGNIEVAQALLKKRGLWPGQYVLLLTSWHIWRATRLFRRANLIPPYICTEELWRLNACDEQDLEYRDEALERLFNQPGYARRLAREMRGLGHELTGAYVPGKC